MENHFIPFQCVVHLHIMVFALWNHRGVRIVSFSAFPYGRRTWRTGTMRRDRFYTQNTLSVFKCLSVFCKIMARATEGDFFWGMILQSQQRNRENGSNSGNHFTVFWKANSVTITEETLNQRPFQLHTHAPRSRYLSEQGSAWGASLSVSSLFCG